jgi:hypothetical protein
VEAGATAAVLGCAVALFLNIKKVLKRCSQLTRRETLFRLHQVFQKVLVSFAQRLSAKIPSPPSAVKLSESYVPLPPHFPVVHLTSVSGTPLPNPTTLDWSGGLACSVSVTPTGKAS